MAKPKPDAFPSDAVRPLLEQVVAALPKVRHHHPAIRNVTWTPERTVERQKVTRRPPVRRKGFSRPYVVAKGNDARGGTWRHLMLHVILNNTNTRDAENRLAELVPADHKFAGHKLDWNWTEKSGYIRFV